MKKAAFLFFTISLWSSSLQSSSRSYSNVEFRPSEENNHPLNLFIGVGKKHRFKLIPSSSISPSAVKISSDIMEPLWINNYVDPALYEVRLVLRRRNSLNYLNFYSFSVDTDSSRTISIPIQKTDELDYVVSEKTRVNAELYPIPKFIHLLPTLTGLSRRKVEKRLARIYSEWKYLLPRYQPYFQNVMWNRLKEEIGLTYLSKIYCWILFPQVKCPVPSLSEVLSMVSIVESDSPTKHVIKELQYNEDFLKSITSKELGLLFRKKHQVPLELIVTILEENVHSLSLDQLVGWTKEAIMTCPIKLFGCDILTLTMKELYSSRFEDDNEWVMKIWEEMLILEQDDKDLAWAQGSFGIVFRIIYSATPQFFQSPLLQSRSEANNNDDDIVSWITQNIDVMRFLSDNLSLKEATMEANFILGHLDTFESVEKLFVSIDFFLSVADYCHVPYKKIQYSILGLLLMKATQRAFGEDHMLSIISCNRHHALGLWLDTRIKQEGENISSIPQILANQAAKRITCPASYAVILQRYHHLHPARFWKYVYGLNNGLFDTITFIYYNNVNFVPRNDRFILTLPYHIALWKSIDDILTVLRTISFLLLQIPFEQSITILSGFDDQETLDCQEYGMFINFWLQSATKREDHPFKGVVVDVKFDHFQFVRSSSASDDIQSASLRSTTAPSISQHIQEMQDRRDGVRRGVDPLRRLARQRGQKALLPATP